MYTLAIAVNTACHLTFLPERLYNSLAYICLLPFGSRRLCCRRGGFFLSLRFYQSHRFMDIFARIILQNPLPEPLRLLPMLAKPAFPPAAHFIRMAFLLFGTTIAGIVHHLPTTNTKTKYTIAAMVKPRHSLSPPRPGSKHHRSILSSQLIFTPPWQKRRLPHPQYVKALAFFRFPCC